MNTVPSSGASVPPRRSARPAAAATPPAADRRRRGTPASGGSSDASITIGVRRRAASRRRRRGRGARRRPRRRVVGDGVRPRRRARRSGLDGGVAGSASSIGRLGDSTARPRSARRSAVGRRAGAASAPARRRRRRRRRSTVVGDLDLRLDVGRGVRRRRRAPASGSSGPAAPRPRGCRGRCLRSVRASASSAENASQQLVEDLRRRHVVGRAASALGSDGRRRARPAAAHGVVPEPDEADLAAQQEAGRGGDRAGARASITARTSAAVPPSAAWMKLACFSDTHAVPMREPAQAEPVDSSPALTSPGTGLTNTEPAVLAARLVLAAPAHDLGDRRLGRPPGRRARAAAARRARPGGRRGRSRGSAGRARSAGDRHDRAPAREVEHVDVDEAGGDVASRGRRRSSAPRRRPSRARRPPTRSRSRPAAAVRRASTGRATAAAGDDHACRRRRRSSPASVGERDGDAGEPVVGDEQVRAAADDEHRQPGRAACRGDGEQVVERRGRARTAPPAPPTRYVVSGAERHVALGERRRARRRPRRSRRRRSTRHGRPPRRAPGEHLVGQRGDVAAAHRDAHVAGARPRRRGTTTRSVAARQPHDARVGVGVEHGVDDELAGDAGDRRRARRVDVGEHDDVGVDERVAVLRRQLGHAVVAVRLERRRRRAASRRRCRGRRRARRRSRSAGGRSRRRAWRRRRRRGCRSAGRRRRSGPSAAAAVVERRRRARAPSRSRRWRCATLCTPRSGSVDRRRARSPRALDGERERARRRRRRSTARTSASADEAVRDRAVARPPSSAHTGSSAHSTFGPGDLGEVAVEARRRSPSNVP